MRQPTFEAGQVVLVPAVRADLEPLWQIWCDPDVRRYLFDDQPVDRGRAAEVLARCLGEAANGIGLWTIRERTAPETIVGCAGLMPITWEAYDPTAAGLLEPIVALAPSVWHRGHAVTALRRLIAYAYDDLGLARLAGATDVPNEASHRMLTRAGFVAQRECPGPYYRMRTYLHERVPAVKEPAMPDRAAFRRAVERHDVDALIALFRDDAVLHSPITFSPFEGKPAIRRLLGIILEVFQDFRYTDELDAADGGTKALVFRTRVRNRDVEGVDLVRFDDGGMIRDLTVMVRPRSGLEALLAEVQPRLMAALQGDAAP
jgi:RimJ/RimL family protein N-acetyltransferase